MEHQNVSNISVFAHTSTDVVACSVVMGLCWALGVPGNLAVMVLLGPHLKDCSFTPKLMLSLAVSDLLSLMSLPVWIWALLKGWVFGQALCKLFSYAVYWSIYSSVLSVSLMSLQRYLQVLYPQRWAKIRARRKNWMIVGLWATSGALASYALYYRNVKRKNNGRMSCFDVYGNNKEKIAILLLETVVMFILPLLCLLCFYLRLHQRLRRSVSFSSHRLTSLSVRIVVTFFILGTPCAINNFVAIGLDSDINRSVTRALFFINSCVNPFLYAFSARKLWSRGTQHSEQPQDQQNPTG